MRLHSLQVTAFGPFAGTIDVDFDALSESGLFLLSGDNGAGKTSILDAVCFALYGAVPGERQQAKQLRCDRAAPGLAPEVRLELTLQGRRFRIVRSPGWLRPKKRGAGLTQQQPAVTLSERRGDTWLALATRLDDAGDLLGSLLGLTLDQFCQVVLLPQGRFEAFLRASSPERQSLLQQVFRLGRFERVEEWLREHRRVLGRESAELRSHVGEVVHRISESSGEPAPEAWQEGAFAVLLDWTDERRTEARARAASAAEDATRTELELVGSAEHLTGARRVHAARQRHDEASAALTTLLAASDDVQLARDRLASAREAAPLTHLAATRESAAEELDRLTVRATALTAEAHVEPGELPTSAAEARAAVERAEALVPLETRLATVRATVADLEARETAAGSAVAAVESALAALPAEVSSAREALAAAEAGALRRPELRALLEARTAERQAQVELAGLRAELATARALAATSIEAAQDAKQVWLDLREARLSGYAAELAAELAVGADCPVCGSAEHPHPAVTRPDAPTAELERAARAACDDAEAVRHAHEQNVRDLQTSIGLAEQRAGQLSRADLDDLIPTLSTELAEATDLAAALPGRRTAVEALDQRDRRLREEHAQARVELAAATAALTTCRSDAESLDAEHCAGFAALGFDGSDPAAHRRELTGRSERLSAAAEAEARRIEAEQALTRATERLEREAVAVGFPDADAAVSALLDRAELEALEASLRTHDHEVVRLRAALAEPEVAAAAALPVPDLDTLEAQHERASAAARGAAAEAIRHDTTLQRLDALCGELLDALAAWGPVRDAHALADRVASLTDGSSADNPLKLRLSGYVVAFRLAQVVAAANERLRAIEPRFTLEHTGKRGAGETRGGLSLLIRDDWSGETRDPVTLSGGETFVVSLSLALGLADVIAYEAGGSELETLFVDEGFGSLDPHTLDRVMDTLDSLREGRRVVGVVSHVSEMRDRIPAQLRLDKDGVRQGRAGAVTQSVGA
jgi:exonuclease SbcC